MWQELATFVDIIFTWMQIKKLWNLWIINFWEQGRNQLLGIRLKKHIGLELI